MISIIPRRDTDNEGATVEGVLLCHQVCEEGLVVRSILQNYIKCHCLIQVIKQDTGLFRNSNVQT